MSILIKGMGMPTNCEKCPFLDYEEGFCFASGVKMKSGWYEYVLCPGGTEDGRHKDCPLVPVPPHGRLIDADALVRDNGIKEIPEYYEVVRDAPTIIPAEEGET